MIINKLKALSDESRLRIFHLLFENELNVHEIQSILSMGQSRVSRHLKILTDSGILSCRKDGLWVFYRSSDEKISREMGELLLPELKNEELFQNDLNELKFHQDERTKKGKEFFDSIANSWPHIKDQLFGDFDLNSIISGKIDSSLNIADLGCGDGELMVQIMKDGRNLIGVDRSAKMLELAEKRLGEPTIGSFDLRLGELNHIPVRDSEVDCAVINMVLHFLDSPEIAIEETSRIIKKSGRLILAEFESHGDENFRSKYGHRWLGFDKLTLTNWLKKWNFDLPEVETFEIKRGLKLNVYSSIKM